MFKSQAKYIRSLAQQKNRKEHNAYIAEGEKLAREWLESSAAVKMIAGLDSWINAHKSLTDRHPHAEIITVSASELEGISTLKTPNEVLLVVEMPEKNTPLPENEWCIALDTVQDPGNLGTIIRIADWFGIRHVICSPGCADAFSPKVIQSAMGGHLRVQVHITDLPDFVLSTDMPVIAATLSGENVYQMPPFDAGVLLIGNESKGLAPGLVELATHTVMIPRRGGAESLNAAVSAGILCALLMPGL